MLQLLVSIPLLVDSETSLVRHFRKVLTIPTERLPKVNDSIEILSGKYLKIEFIDSAIIYTEKGLVSIVQTYTCNATIDNYILASLISDDWEEVIGEFYD